MQRLTEFRTPDSGTRVCTHSFTAQKIFVKPRELLWEPDAPARRCLDQFDDQNFGFMQICQGFSPGNFRPNLENFGGFYNSEAARVAFWARRLQFLHSPNRI
jgi:hypothetical protein